MSAVTTLPYMLWPLMDAPSVDTSPRCAVCGRYGHVERHHMVRRSAGRMFRDGVEVPKPTITLCGYGNTSGCHGLAHQNRLHFRYEGGELQYIVCPEPTKYEVALGMDGWRAVRS